MSNRIPDTYPAEYLVDEPQPPVNWAALFITYQAGSTLEDIAQACSMPLETLQEVADREGWAALASGAPLSSADDPQGKFATLEANRRANFDAAVMLRNALLSDARRLQEGTLRLEKVFCNKDGIITAPIIPGPQDHAAYARALQLIADVTYRALGDQNEAERKTGKPGETRGEITIVLPAAIQEVQEASDLPKAPEMSIERATALAAQSGPPEVVVGIDDSADATGVIIP